MRRLFLVLSFASLAVGRAQQTETNAAPAATPPPAADSAAAPSAAPVDPAKEAEIRKLIENSGIRENMKLVMSRMIETYRSKNPSVPPEFWTQVESDSSLDDLISRLVPIYSQYYSLDDLKAINAFYDSPAGLHMKQVQPEISGAAMLAGRQWGQEMGAKIMSGVLAQQAKNYAQDDKKTYYTAVSTNGAPSTPAADSTTNSAPAAP